MGRKDLTNCYRFWPSKSTAFKFFESVFICFMRTKTYEDFNVSFIYIYYRGPYASHGPVRAGDNYKAFSPTGKLSVKNITAKILNYYITQRIYLLLTEFEVRTVSYGGSVSYNTDRDDEVGKIFIISLLCALKRVNFKSLLSRTHV